MNKRLKFALSVFSICLMSCHMMTQRQMEAATNTPAEASPTQIPPTQVPLTQLTPTPAPPTQIPLIQTIESPNAGPIQPFQDVRNLDLTKLGSNLNRSLIETLWFNESTHWPDQYKNIAQDILQRGMNPGLGIRKLHEQGITGKGVSVAIIDQNMVLDHPEFQGKIVKYFDVGTKQLSGQGSMHGPAVTSLLVGKNIGTAPDAKVYYVAAPSWTLDAQYYADALNWIIDENEKLPAGEKIRVVSVSANPSGPGTNFTKNNEAWDAAYQRAADAGILILDCTSNHGITAPCFLDLDDPDNVAKCTPGYPSFKNTPTPDRIYVPVSFRTTAEEYTRGIISYQYAGEGGISWSVPYLSGVLALGWQLRPDLTSSQLLDLIFNSAYLTGDHLKIIDPVAFIDMVRLTSNP